MNITGVEYSAYVRQYLSREQFGALSPENDDRWIAWKLSSWILGCFATHDLRFQNKTSRESFIYRDNGWHVHS